MDRIAFTGGGTGGHVFPALAVYEHLPTELQRRVLWIGSRGGIERQLVREAGITYRAIPTGKLRRYLSWENVTDVGRVFLGIAHAYRALEGVRVLFSKGGFVAVPVVLAAAWRRIPILIHESDNDPGLATRLTAPWARRIFVPYEGMKGILASSRPRVRVSGNPIRSSIATAKSEGALEAVGISAADDAPVVLITGGSIGARALNEAAATVMAELTAHAIVVHQTGEHGAPLAAELNRRLGPSRYHGASFFGAAMGALIARADLVVARAGAGTVWELAALGRPAVLLPLSAAVSRGDQVRNAQRYRRAGAAVVILAHQLTPERLLTTVLALLHDPLRREAMSAAARRWGTPGAAQFIAAEIAHCYRQTRGANV